MEEIYLLELIPEFVYEPGFIRDKIEELKKSGIATEDFSSTKPIKILFDRLGQPTLAYKLDKSETAKTAIYKKGIIPRMSIWFNNESFLHDFLTNQSTEEVVMKRPEYLGMVH